MDSHNGGHSIEMAMMRDAATAEAAEDTENDEPGPPGPPMWDFVVSFAKIIFMFALVASIWGVVLNFRQYGEIGGVSKDSYAPAPPSFINVFFTSAAVALPVLLLRSALRLYSHRHYHQGFCLVAYVALVALIQHEAYTFQPSLRNGGSYLQSTLERMLYTAPISNTYNVVSFASLRDAGDFYTWLRGPLRQFIFGPTKCKPPVCHDIKQEEALFPLQPICYIKFKIEIYFHDDWLDAEGC